MSFNINFSASKPSQKASNENKHDEIYWGFAYALAEKSTPINQWPTQYTVHYIYEFLNRPWLPERQRLEEMTQWLSSYAPDLKLNIES
jgi:hypothetical protein